MPRRQITMPSRQSPTLVMAPSEILPVSSTSRAFVETCHQGGLAEPALTPAANVLEPGERPLEMHGGHRRKPE